MGYLRQLHKLQEALLRKMDTKGKTEGNTEKDNYGKGK